MSLYEFSTPESGVIEIPFPIGTAPGIGTTYTPESGSYAGIPLVRLASIPQTSVAPNFNFASHSLPRNTTDHDRFDEKGRPVFTSKKEVTEYVAKTEGGVVWD